MDEYLYNLSKMIEEVDMLLLTAQGRGLKSRLKLRKKNLNNKLKIIQDEQEEEIFIPENTNRFF